MPSVVGLDLSLRCAAAVALPVDFSEGLRWSRATWTTVGSSLDKGATEAERCARMRRIADGLLAFTRSTDARHVWLEEQAFAQSGAMSREIAGMTWLVKLTLIEAGYLVRTVPSTQARKVFLGHAKRGAKQAVQQALRDIVAPFADSDDCCDAFVIANFAASELGGRALMLGGLAA